MTKEFLNSIGMMTLDEYKEIHGDNKETEDTFYRTVLRQTDETLIVAFESFLAVFDDSTALTLVSNLFRWASDVLTSLREYLAARKEAREHLADNRK